MLLDLLLRRLRLRAALLLPALVLLLLVVVLRVLCLLARQLLGLRCWLLRGLFALRGADLPNGGVVIAQVHHVANLVACLLADPAE